MTFQLTTRPQPQGQVLVHVTGDLDARTSNQLLHQLLAILRASHPDLVVDLSAVAGIDPAGLGILLAVAAQAHTAGGSLQLVKVPTHVRQVITHTGTHHRFTFARPFRDAADAN